MGHASIPRGGLHGYFHAILRAAVHHGATIRTSCPVEEILVEDGRAVGVRLRETAASGGKTIHASKAVIAACDVHQAFLDMVGPRHLDPSVIQKLKDISLKNQTLYVSTFHTKEPMRFNERFARRCASHEVRRAEPHPHGRRLSLRFARALLRERGGCGWSQGAAGRPAGGCDVVPDALPGLRSHRLPGQLSGAISRVHSRWR